MFFWLPSLFDRTQSSMKATTSVWMVVPSFSTALRAARGRDFACCSAVNPPAPNSLRDVPSSVASSHDFHSSPSSLSDSLCTDPAAIADRSGSPPVADGDAVVGVRSFSPTVDVVGAAGCVGTSCDDERLSGVCSHLSPCCLFLISCFLGCCRNGARVGVDVAALTERVVLNFGL